MAGVNATTGAPLDGFEHVEQSLNKIFTTRQGERVMREWFGNPGLRLLGENATPLTVLLWFTILWTLIELFEPRYRVRRFAVNDINRIGFGDFTIVGEYRPYAHLGWQQAALFISFDGESVTVKPAL
jgi:phage baseplate assembly protein W